jgi:hypothetical protein
MLSVATQASGESGTLADCAAAVAGVRQARRIAAALGVIVVLRSGALRMLLLVAGSVTGRTIASKGVRGDSARDAGTRCTGGASPGWIG